MKSKLSVSTNKIRKYSNKFFLFSMILFIGIGFTHNHAVAENLSLDVPTGEYAIGQTFTIGVDVDNPANVLGAAFTLKFVDSSGDPAPVEVVSVGSGFFGTFQQQFVETGLCIGCPTQADTGEIQPLESKEWTQDFQANTINAVRVAAARADSSYPTDPTNIPLFSIDLKYTAGAIDTETYKAQIIPTSLYNEAAGYKNTAGTEIDLLVGASGDTFPVLLSSAGFSTVEADLPTPSGEASIPVDADGDGNSVWSTDGIMILRNLFGMTPEKVVEGAVGPSCTRCTAQDIDSWLTTFNANYDVDGDGNSVWSTDGIMILRDLFGMTPEKVIEGAVGPDCTRCNATDIAQYIDGIK